MSDSSMFHKRWSEQQSVS